MDIFLLLETLLECFSLWSPSTVLCKSFLLGPLLLELFFHSSTPTCLWFVEEHFWMGRIQRCLEVVMHGLCNSKVLSCQFLLLLLYGLFRVSHGCCGCLVWTSVLKLLITMVSPSLRISQLGELGSKLVFVSLRAGLWFPSCSHIVVSNNHLRWLPRVASFQ